ncbi:ribosome biogenesis GTPase YlqF [Lactobacillus sp. DCY120]|uniref:Ribosome biogenesis GTPase A n=1 Tax=Bombilactobacillus apium TaxID=2675299 RepID=A0A850R174_9LACO|nr:ribosome biogenesis GTPase YlqF [Bombilactobacillus apium]NVY95771.1 ribosome biogenesis GTPase YlqF [Bombilactobacillus apium]
MTIQWYPGHMNKAKNQIQANLKFVDVVLELRDARLPLASANPVLKQIVPEPKRIIILNKSDLADGQQTQQWVRYFQEQGVTVVPLDVQHHQNLSELTLAIEQKLAPRLKKYQQSGVRNYTIRAMCVGIPNVGKSTLLNKLVGKKVAVTGNRPGVTKNQNWLKAPHNLELLDTPGVLWPKIEDQTNGLKLALSGAIKDSLVSASELAVFALDFWRQYYPAALQKMYQLDDSDLKVSGSDLLIHLTQAWAWQEDYERTAQKIIQDVRQLRLGRYSLDRVENNHD